MKTKAEVRHAIYGVFGVQPGTILETKNYAWGSNGYNVEVEISTITTAQLFKLADLLGTKNIDIDSWYSSGGCSTCDFGSARGYELNIWWE